MKKLLLLSIYLLLNHFSYSNPIVKTTSKITQVTIFPNGAMINREIDISKLQGDVTIEITGLPNDLFKKSIVVEGHDEIDIVSIISSVENSQGETSAQFYSNNNKAILLHDSLAYYYALKTTLASEKEMITSHSNFENDDGYTNIDEVIKASDFYKKRIKEIELELLDISKSIRFFNAEILKIDIRNDSITKEKLKTEFRVNIKATLKNKNAKPIHLKYFIPKASWHIYYDLKVNNIEQPAILNRKAYVRQNTGEDWTDVKLILSNADPIQDNQIPNLDPHKLINPNTYSPKSNYKIYGTIVDEQGLPIFGANINMKGTTIGTISQIDGSFEIESSYFNKIVISYTGYLTTQLIPKPSYNYIIMKEGELLSEVVIRGQTTGSSNRYTNGIKVKNKENKKALKEAEELYNKKEAMKLLRNSVKQTKLNAINSVEYHIEENYSIKSDNKEIDVLLNIEMLNCNYEHFAIPLKSPHTYLTLKIPDWHKLDLLKGHVNLFLSNTYKGQSSIDPNITLDTLSISIGVDPEVVIERELLKENYEKKLFGKNIEEYFTYKTTIKNNKSSAINIKILDQVPISTHEDIEVKNINTVNANFNTDNGVVEWKGKMTPGQSNTKLISYSVRYPKKFAGLLN